MLLLLLHASGYTSDKLLSLLLHEKIQRLNFHFHIVAFVQVILHDRHDPSFPSTPDTLLCLQIRLPLAFIRRRMRNLLVAVPRLLSMPVRCLRTHQYHCGENDYKLNPKTIPVQVRNVTCIYFKKKHNLCRLKKIGS